MRANDILTIADTVRKMPYIDVLLIWLKTKPSENQVRRIRRHCGSLRYENEPMKFNSHWLVSLTVRQPSVEALQLLQGLAADACRITYVEFALDLIPDEPQMVSILRTFVDQTITLPDTRGRKAKDVLAGLPKDVGMTEKTLYLRKRSATRNIAIYSDNLSKLVHQTCVHIEYRLRSPQLKRLGITCPNDLVAFDHRAFWSERLRLIEVSTNDAVESPHGEPGLLAQLASRGRGGPLVPLDVPVHEFPASRASRAASRGAGRAPATHDRPRAPRTRRRRPRGCSVTPWRG